MITLGFSIYWVQTLHTSFYDIYEFILPISPIWFLSPNTLKQNMCIIFLCKWCLLSSWVIFFLIYFYIFSWNWYLYNYFIHWFFHVPLISFLLVVLTNLWNTDTLEMTAKFYHLPIVHPFLFVPEEVDFLSPQSCVGYSTSCTYLFLCLPTHFWELISSGNFLKKDMKRRGL